MEDLKTHSGLTIRIGAVEERIKGTKRLTKGRELTQRKREILVTDWTEGRGEGSRLSTTATIKETGGERGHRMAPFT